MAHRVVRVAAVQAAPAFLDGDATLDRLEQWARRAAGEGAQVIGFPETWVPGYPAWLDDSPGSALWGHEGAKAVFARLFANSMEVPGPATERIGKLARALKATLVVGVHERAGRTLYNSLLTFGPDGALVNHHRKLMPTGSDERWYASDSMMLRINLRTSNPDFAKSAARPSRSS